MTDHEWHAIEYSVLVAARPKGLTETEREMWMKDAMEALSNPYLPLVQLLRQAYLTTAKQNGWKAKS